jgi:hypothetical protein
MHQHSRPAAGRVGVDPILVPGTHEAILTHPNDVAKALTSPDLCR